MTLGRYRVTGNRNYRGHDPGTLFDAKLTNGAAARAIARGDIEFLGEVRPELPEGSYRLPPDWLQSSTPNTQAPEGAFFVPKGGT